jgi:hypothetical protein
MADDRRRFLERVIRECDGVRREQLLLRLEQIENTGAQGVVPVLNAGDDATVFLAKLPFKDESGEWRYGLFDPTTRPELLPEGERPMDEPVLISERSWRRSRYDPRPPDPDRRKRSGH